MEEGVGGQPAPGHSGHPIVVKIGGSTLGSHDTSLRDLVQLQREGREVVVVHGGHLSSEPYDDRTYHQKIVVQPKMLDQVFVEMGKVNDGVQLVGPFAAEKAGMGRRVDGELLGQRTAGGIKGPEASAAVQEEEGRS